MRPLIRQVGVLAVFASLSIAQPAPSDVSPEPIGRVESLPLPYEVHWVWVGDPLLRRSALVDVDAGEMRGIVGSGFGLPLLLQAAGRSEVLSVETHYSRGSRGTRTDALTIYDASTLAPKAEVILPPKRALGALATDLAAIGDDERFAYVFNLTPATSVTVVDLDARVVSAEIATPGCSLVYPAGARRFAMLCMDGAMLVLDLDETGKEKSRLRTDPFFDPEEDPVIEKATRIGNRWFFATFDGWLRPVLFEGEKPVFEEAWPLVTSDERAAGWKIGGEQLLAAYEPGARLYALMHEGGEWSHKQAGTEVWVYDAVKRERVQRIELVTPGLTYLGVPIRADGFLGWLIEWLGNSAMQEVPELGIGSIVVTQDASPLLVTVGSFSGGIATYDALSGVFVRRVYSGNMTNAVLVPPLRARGAVAAR